MIRPVQPDDAKQILAIYSYYVFNSHSTFELSPPSTKEMRKKIKDSEYPWIVFENEDAELIGYAYANRWKARKAYDRTAETSVYIHKKHFGKGIAKELYKVLLNRLREMNMHAILAGISMPNEASVRLHEKFGFKKVGQLEQVGYKFDGWIDVGYWQLTFD